MVRRPPCDVGESGAGAPLVIGAIAAVMIAGLTLIGAASAVAGALRVGVAADAAALAAADVMLGWVAGDPCETAARVARAHDTALVDCRAGDLSMIVTARATILGVTVERSARAGPPGAREVRTRAPCVWCA